MLLLLLLPFYRYHFTVTIIAITVTITIITVIIIILLPILFFTITILITIIIISTTIITTTIVLQLPRDAQLFQIKHLLILREQISAFDNNFSVTEVSLDWTRTKGQLCVEGSECVCVWEGAWARAEVHIVPVVHFC